MVINVEDIKSYSELQLFANGKGLSVLIGEKDSFLQNNIIGKNELGYAVVKNIGGIEFVVDKSGNLYYDEYFDGPYRIWTVRFQETLEEAWEIVNNFKKDEKSPDFPQFYGFIRIYEGENFFLYYEMQKMLLENWAKLNNIQFKTIFGCFGGNAEFQGKPSNIYECDNFDGICNTQYSCRQYFENMKHNDVLCITSWDRLDGEPMYWKEGYNIKIVSTIYDNNVYEYKQPSKKSEVTNNYKDDLPF